MGPIQSSTTRNVLNPGPKRRADILFTLCMLGVAYLAWRVRDVLLIIYVSALFAVVITPAIHLIQRVHIGRWHPGRGLAFLIILFALLACFSFFLIFAMPPILQNAREFARELPNQMANLTAKLRSLPLMSKVRPPNLEAFTGAIFSNTFGVAKGLAGGIFGLFTGIILTAYFVFSGRNVFDWSMSLVSLEHRERLTATFLRAEKRMRHWLIGQGALMLILGASSALVFGLLHLRYFYALAVFAGLANIVPFVGPVTSAILASVVALTDSWQKLAGVLAFYLVYQQVENGFLTPRIMKTTVDLPPLAVIIALLLGGSLAGILGALVAVPTAALVAEFVQEYLVKRPAPVPREIEHHEPENVREW
jgi:predicted PurR-regulated permease PerM